MFILCDLNVFFFVQPGHSARSSGLPKRPVITSSPIGGESNSYTLTWETESYYPITEFLIKYRKAHLGGWPVSGGRREGGRRR